MKDFAEGGYAEVGAEKVCGYGVFPEKGIIPS